MSPFKLTVPTLENSEFTNKEIDHAIDLVRRASKRVDYLHTVYGVASLRESYVRGDAVFHYHIFTEGTNISDYCAVYQRHPGLEVMDVRKKRFGARPDISDAIYAWRTDEDELQITVLVGIVHLLEKPKGRPPTPIPSVIWLQPLDLCPVLTSQVRQSPAMPSLPLGNPFPWAVQEDGERRPDALDIDRPVLQYGQLADNVVESRPQVVGNLASDNRPSKRSFAGQISFDSEPIETCFAIELGHNNTMRIRLKKMPDVRVEGYDLFMCPVHLGDCTVEYAHNGR